MSTLKQKRLAEAIPESGTMLEAGEKAGYSKKARGVYRPHTKRHIAKLLEEKGITKEWGEKMIREVIKLGLAKEDLSNVNRSLDLILTVAGVKVEKKEIKDVTKDEFWTEFQKNRGNRVKDLIVSDD